MSRHIIFEMEQFAERNFIRVFECSLPENEKEEYIGLIFKDRISGLFIAKDAKGNELFPRAETHEEQQERFIQARERTITEHKSTQSLNR